MESEMSAARTARSNLSGISVVDRINIVKWITGFMAYAVVRGDRHDFPAFGDQPWHLFLWKLKGKYPSVFSHLVFERDGRFPTCAGCSELLLGFSHTCDLVSPLMSRMVLKGQVSRYMNYLEACCDVQPDDVMRIAEECGFWKKTPSLALVKTED